MLEQMERIRKAGANASDVGAAVSSDAAAESGNGSACAGGVEGVGAYCRACAVNGRAAWDERYASEKRSFCEEIQHLRGAGQKMVDQLAAYMPPDSLKAFSRAMRLDSRVFTIPGEFDVYRDTPFPVEEAVSRKELAQVIAERDVAKMRLAVTNKELQELRASHEALRWTLSTERETAKVAAQQLVEAEARLSSPTFAGSLGAAASAKEAPAYEDNSVVAAGSACELDCNQASARRGSCGLNASRESKFVAAISSRSTLSHTRSASATQLHNSGRAASHAAPQPTTETMVRKRIGVGLPALSRSIDAESAICVNGRRHRNAAGQLAGEDVSSVGVR